MKMKRIFAIATLAFFLLTSQVFAAIYGVAPYPKFKGYTPGTSDPLVGGYLYTCVVGTACAHTFPAPPPFPQVTYIDAVGSGTNTNPIILDSNGEADVWLPTYVKLALYDSAGVNVWTIDNVPPSSNDVSNIAYAASWDGVTTIAPSKNAVYDEMELRALAANPTFTGVVTTPVIKITAGAAAGDVLTSDAAGTASWQVPSYVPVGAIFAFPTETAPTGYLECNGASVLRATYPNLWGVIGVTFGSVDGTHFTLPNLRGEFLRGWDHGAGVDPDAATRTDRGDGVVGDHVGTKQADAFKAHTHAGMSATLAGSGGPASRVDGGVQVTNSTGGNETRPVNVYVMWCIKY